MKHRSALFAITSLTLSLLITGCSGGESVEDNGGCDGFCSTSSSFLNTAEVEQILAQAIQEAQAQGEDATIAVVDRVGNILAVYRMGNASERRVLIATETNSSGDAVIDSGLEGIALPTTGVGLNIDDQAAIAKALTGAYLSSEGNAFSSRTASQIVQEHFNPGEENQPSGPLFGVQFSQLSCSDFTVDDPLSSNGPKRSPLGLSADPGGLPLYKNGAPVGGIGVIADGLYSIDKSISDVDQSMDEIIALAGTVNFSAPIDRRADRITVEGKTLRFSDATQSDLRSNPNSAPAFASFGASVGNLISVAGYSDGSVQAGEAFGEITSGIRAANVSEFPASLDAHIFVDPLTDTNRYPAVDGSDALLSAAEVQAVLEEALAIANRARAQIRRPLGSIARVNIAVVDTNGAILGMVRSRDAPIFGADVSIQKARTAAFYSSANGAAFLNAQPDASYFNISDSAFALSTKEDVAIDGYLTNAQNFLGNPAALSTGGIAYSDRAGGNLSRPFYPDGIVGNPPGPFSKPQGSWSVFSTGLQLDLVFNGIIQHVLSVASGNVVPDITDRCTGVSFDPEGLAFAEVDTSNLLANGSQIFPGSVPIFRGNTLVGGIGVSGDGVDQDDMIAFLGVHNAGLRLAGSINNAPIAMRAYQLSPNGVRLRFIQCPQAPFLDSDEDNVCAGK